MEEKIDKVVETKTIRISKLSHEILIWLQLIEPAHPNMQEVLDRIIREEYARKKPEIEAYQSRRKREFQL